MVKRDISEPISKDTVRSVQGKNSLNWTLVQRKEILAKNDLKLGLTFAPKVFRKQGLNLWEEDVRFYLDGASVTHKMDDFDQDRAPRAIAWRKPGPGFNFTLTAEKFQKNTEGNVVHFMAAIADGNYVIVAEQYHIE